MYRLITGRQLIQHRVLKRSLHPRHFCKGSIYNAVSDGSPDVPANARVVIGGGGIVGASVAYHLAERGWTDVTLLEQGRLTCGTTWHAVGLIGQVRDTLSTTKLMGYSKQLYKKLEKEYGVGLKECGSITVAQTPDRMTLLRRSQSIAKAAGVEATLVTKADIHNLCKWIRTDDIEGGLWIPGDGALTAPDLAITYAKAAKAKGVQIIEGVKVNRINTSDGQVSGVQTSHGHISCEYFVNCSGQWGRNLGRLSDPPVNIPQHPLEHFYIVSQPIEGLDRMMPVVRDYDGLIYAREWSGGIMTGGFEPKGKPVFGEAVPDKFEFQLLSEDWDHFQVLMDGILNRFPILETTQIRQFVNGPESFTPDNMWNVGESAEVKNYFVATGMGSNGIAGSGGLGRHMAELISGEPTSVNLSSVDVKRHAQQQGDIHYLANRCAEVIGRYKLKYPDDQYKTARELLVSPLHSKLMANGACFGEESAYEKPLWFSDNQAPYNTAKGTFGKPSWLEPVRAEYLACKNHVGMFDVSCFTQIEIKSAGSEALDALQTLVYSYISGKEGEVTRTGMLNPRGGFELVCDIVTTKSNSFILLCPSPQKARCLTWVRRHIPKAVQVTDVSGTYAALHLIGENVLKMLSEVTDDMTSISLQSNSQMVNIGQTKDIAVLKQNLAGMVGTTLLVPSQGAVDVYDTLMNVGEKYGIRNAGHHTLRLLQTENVYPQWLKDFTSGTTPMVTGMADMVDFQKTSFIGKEALIAASNKTDATIVCLELEDFCVEEDSWVWGGEPIYCDGRVAGSVSSTGFDFTKNTVLCMGTVSLAKDKLSSKSFQVDVCGKSYKVALK
ncbi:pyruvate dehydrogenase phosphatase regulatory subunit, mitochondrial-like [Mizuhopecten yessoensis]|uniref:Pyruvate dehydrogenase phosphatase regulatory subunit, mitochondrial n=1 Tax=Mizuhopecten yessoensis TaxID=6573 RepID=A0A210QXQ2_MIZYE|nr:pyruvate dehydrogenase phosphatase regulatory subunit, mitochondrial-like [Mizuhopecten yessoensis]OWF53505.1 Pyruvate dehydrogenase phosphatase regulatory subunit, mitochondrial [Mizuhopecten yessoensis]